jgi:hypothetical protein
MKNLIILVVTLLGLSAWAEEGIVINGTEWGIGKFHRMDNKARPYSPGNSWAVSIPPEGANGHPLVYETSKNVYSIQFFTLEELLVEAAKLSKTTGLKIILLNIHGHGMPGGMWFPTDEKMLKSLECKEWRASAKGDDVSNYNQYYTTATKAEIKDFRNMSKKPAHYECTTGLREWQKLLARLGDFKQFTSPNTVVNFLSCLVGLGPVGDEFTLGVAKLLLPPGGRGMVRTSLNFGLTDWSMEKGMGFWDYQNDAQLKRDTQLYNKNKRDADVAQHGQIRVVTAASGEYISSVLADQPWLVFSHLALKYKSSHGLPGRIFRSGPIVFESAAPNVLSLRIPGTPYRAIRIY